MFLNKYVSVLYLELIYDTYDEEFLANLDENNFIKIYNLLKESNLYFVDDIVLNYLEIFQMDYNDVYNGLLKLKEKLGNNYNYIIGSRMNYLEEIISVD